MEIETMAYRVRQGDSWASLGTKYPKIKENNPGISNPKPGMVLETGYEAPKLSTQNPYSQYHSPKNPYGQYNYMNNTYQPNNVAGGRGNINNFMNSYQPNSVAGGRGNITINDYKPGGRGTMNPEPDMAAAYFTAIQVLNEQQAKPKQKTYVQQWAEGSMTGAQMRAIYGKGWKDRMKIKTPKGKLKSVAKKPQKPQLEEANGWMMGATTEPSSWRI